ncbi:response regulator [Thermomonas carbonis]|uniref:Response regulator n=1 Tax=Thermomonas carbonis TaxID=1463158 RepID=A0A7G9ST24_9GAMM|nr:response regulator [Thermomonas carbonis]QNN70999.1 response regulator [Thermomonas carbonis]GHC03837.1 response regulator [Thermomonas carbonis]
MSGHQILLVEDNPDDVELTRLAFAEAGSAHRLQAVSDGAEALDYLLARGRHGGRDAADLPALVLLDLNLPRLDGRDVLKAIRATPATQCLPVVVLTTSAEPRDVDQAYALGANSYIQKPVEFERFVEVVRQVGRYWLAINLPPGRC